MTADETEYTTEAGFLKRFSQNDSLMESKLKDTVEKLIDAHVIFR